MDLSIVILTRSQPEILPECVASCVREIQVACLAGEVILVDNASTDGSPQRVASQFPCVSIIRNEQNQSFSAGNNQGIRASHGHAVLILNDDAILCPGSLRQMLLALDSEATIGAVGPKLISPDGTRQRGFTNRRFPRFRSLACGLLGLTPWLEKRAWTRDLLTHTMDPERGGETEHIAGACMLARREALDSVGLFDEHYNFWMEDADLCYRLKKRNWKIIYAPQAHVTHYGSASLDHLLASERKMNSIRGVIHYYRQHAPLPVYWALKVVVAFALVAEALVRVVRSMGRRGLRPREWFVAIKATLRDLRAALSAHTY